MQSKISSYRDIAQKSPVMLSFSYWYHFYVGFYQATAIVNVAWYFFQGFHFAKRQARDGGVRLLRHPHLQRVDQNVEVDRYERIRNILPWIRWRKFGQILGRIDHHGGSCELQRCRSGSNCDGCRRFSGKSQFLSISSFRRLSFFNRNLPFR